MTNNTIPNVPRELLERAWRALANSATGREIGAYLDADPCAPECAETCARASMCAACSADLSAPSPAGVDGLEVATYLHTMHMELGQTEQFCSKWRGDPFGVSGVGYSSTYSVTGEPLCRLSDARAIIDGLRGEVAAQRVKTCTALKERNDAREERDAAATECERLRMQLAACGVVALSNTIESAGKARQMHPDYMSASCSDVAGAVDREIALRTERDQQAQRIGELEGLLRESGKTIHKLQAEQPTPARIARYLDAIRAKIDAALSAGKDSAK